jgi:hypothetical protein
MNNPLAFRSHAESGDSLAEIPHQELPAIGVIGGLLTFKQLAEFYRPILDIDTDTDVPGRERFIAPHARGLGQIEDIKEKAMERADKMHARVGKKILWVGHSLGGLIATEIAVERPDISAGVIALGGVHDGYSLETPASFALRHFVGNPPHAKHLRHNSSFMEERRERIGNEWREDIPLDVVSTVLDCLIIPPRGFNIQLPGIQKSNDKLIIPRGWGLEAAVRLGLGIQKEVEIVRSGYFELVEHLNMPRSTTVRESVRNRWLGLAGISATPLAEVPTQIHHENLPLVAVA